MLRRQLVTRPLVNYSTESVFFGGPEKLNFSSFVYAELGLFVSASSNVDTKNTSNNSCA